MGVLWDANGDAMVGSVRYHRISKSDATYSGYWSDDGYGSAAWRYFRYEPIMWRVLKVSGNTALVVADVALDNQRYNANETSVTWETSSIRSWLNGYGAASNESGTDFVGKGFVNIAFSSDERSAILQSNVINADNAEYRTSGGNNTSDKIFLLSEADTYGSGGVSHGFASGSSTRDEARCCKSTDYTRAMGAFTVGSGAYEGNCYWWLRSPGEDDRCAVSVECVGHVVRDGDYVDYDRIAVRPAFNLDLTSAHIQEAGTVSSYWQGDEGLEPQSIADVEISGIKTKTYTGKKQTQSPYVLLDDIVLKKGTDYVLSYKNNINAGTATMYVKGIGGYVGTVMKAFKIKKAANPMKVKAVTRTVKASKLKTKDQVVAPPLKFIQKAQGKVTYKKVGGSKRLFVNKKTGKVTVKKGTKKGTYKIKIKIFANGTTNYNKASKTLTCKIIVK